MPSSSIERILCATLLSAVAAHASARMPAEWDTVPHWTLNQPNNVSFEVKGLRDATRGDHLEVNFDLDGGGWVEMGRDIEPSVSTEVPLEFHIRAETDVNLEIKFSDKDGSVFGRRTSLKGKYKEWTHIIIYASDTEYWWSGDEKLDRIEKIQIAFAGQGPGKVLIDGVGLGRPGVESSFKAVSTLDPDRNMEGFGFRQRQAQELIPEDPGVLAWLKQQQDLGSAERQLVPSMEDGLAQTFNNAIVSMAFILKGERKRAERILDFYAHATDRDNTDKFKQNFFYKGEPRGFFQQIYLKNDKRPAYHSAPGSDRWMGDMAWLYLAFKYHEDTYHSGRYKGTTKLLTDLLSSFYVRGAKDGEGYIAHGWRSDDSKMHETSGHPEGNIDCYAVFKLAGEKKTASHIKRWLDGALKSSKLPLDLYPWRVLALGDDPADLLDTVEHDFMYRKVLEIGGKKVAGFYSTPAEVENIWLDGTGHMACAYFAVGRTARGIFYANQLDAFLIDRNINGIKTRALPYSANKQGDYAWVDPKKGTASAAAWYIFAKNGFNPMTLRKHPVRAR